MLHMTGKFGGAGALAKPGAMTKAPMGGGQEAEAAPWESGGWDEQTFAKASPELSQAKFILPKSVPPKSASPMVVPAKHAVSGKSGLLMPSFQPKSATFVDASVP